MTKPHTTLSEAVRALKPDYLCKGTFEEAREAAAKLVEQHEAQEPVGYALQHKETGHYGSWLYPTETRAMLAKQEDVNYSGPHPLYAQPTLAATQAGDADSPISEKSGGLSFDAAWDGIDWGQWRMQPIRELVRHIHTLTAPEADIRTDAGAADLSISDDETFLTALDDYVAVVSREPGNTNDRIRLRREIFVAADAWNRRAVPQANAEQDAQDKIDAARYRYMRNLTVEQAGAAGQPSIALPSGLNHGYYLTEETADYAIDESIKEFAASNAASEVKNG